MSPRRAAFFDIGTNTILCLIAEMRDTGRFRIIDDLHEIARLGQGVDRTGRIGAEGEERARVVLQKYLDECRKLGVEEFHAVGTSALRDAANSLEVRQRWREQLGLDAQVISGEREAGYSFLAVQRGLSMLGRELLVIDIGGGSTEFIRGNDAGVAEAFSLDVGSVRLTERFLRSDPVRPEESAALFEAIDHQLAPIKQRWQGQAQPLTLVGIAATFTTLVAVEKKLARYAHNEVHASALTLDEVRRQRKIFETKTIAERQQIVGLDPKRADVIYAGASLIERIMMMLGDTRSIVSDQGVRYGLLHERLGQIKNC